MTRIFTLLCLLLASPLPLLAEDSVRRHVPGSFSETRDAVRMAIENRGLVISSVSHIGEMLRRTGADLGQTRPVYAAAEVIEFCSASLSQRLMASDPHHIVLCPFGVAIYTLPGESGTWIAYRKPPARAAALVEPLLQAVVDEASE